MSRAAPGHAVSRWRAALTCLTALAAIAGPGVLASDPAPASAPAPRLLREPVSGAELVLVVGGCFPMGDLFGEGYEEELPVHEVCVGDLYVGRFEVTRAEWKRVMGRDPSSDPGCRRDDCPVENVSWGEAQEFTRRLNGGAAGPYRLPTEAEWEYAARSGGKRERYAGGDDLARLAWYRENSGGRNHPVGGRAPNGLGLHDMSGNVWEWTSDWYADDYYATSPRDHPAGPARRAGPEVDHVIRGGCRTGEAHNERTSRRAYGYQRSSGDRSNKIGFRIVRAP